MTKEQLRKILIIENGLEEMYEELHSYYCDNDFTKTADDLCEEFSDKIMYLFRMVNVLTRGQNNE